LGYRTWTAPSTIRAGEADDDAGALRNAMAGFAVSGLNPKVVLLFIALLPQFAREEAALPMWAQMLALGGIHLANTAVVYFAVAASAKAVLRSRPVVAAAVSRASGVVMMALGGFLLLEQFHLA
jgi:threonine/homoserine/homoserine lactone efflux protein